MTRARFPEVFHEGERGVQAQVGLREHMAEAGHRMIRDHMPEQHRVFFAQLPFVFLAALDASTSPWATIAAGTPGFIRALDSTTLKVEWQSAPDDPVARALHLGADVGVLGIELATRRRNRVNGIVSGLDAAGFTLRVKQSFGNCPQYIQARDLSPVDPSTLPAVEIAESARERGKLSVRAEALIARSDTLFMASATPSGSAADASSGVDVSHRGGNPGFVRVSSTAGTTELVFPDFRGNFFFNTLGNLAVLPRAGLLFIDFESREVLTLTGRAEVEWDGPALRAFQGAERLVRVVVSEGVWLGRVPVQFGRPRYAPQLARTGAWTTRGS